MASYLFVVKAIKSMGKIPAGAEVEIIRSSSSKPGSSEIKDAFESKYGVSCSYNSSSVVIEKK